MLSRRNIILVVAFVCVIVLSGGIAYLVVRDGGSDAGSRADNSSAAPETTMGIDSGSEASSGENYPGAMLGNTQRTRHQDRAEPGDVVGRRARQIE